jgi:hypothetical protein
MYQKNMDGYPNRKPPNEVRIQIRTYRGGDLMEYDSCMIQGSVVVVRTGVRNSRLTD